MLIGIIWNFLFPSHDRATIKKFQMIPINITYSFSYKIVKVIYFLHVMKSTRKSVLVVNKMTGKE